MKEFQRTISIPAIPSRVPSPVCLSEGMIGIAKNGVPIYNPYTSKCCDSGKNVDEKCMYIFSTIQKLFKNGEASGRDEEIYLKEHDHGTSVIESSHHPNFRALAEEPK